jgi:predicted phage tail protein
VVEALLSVLGAGVEHIAAGDTAVVLRSGFEPQADRVPIGPLAAPQNVEAVMADQEREIRVRWRSVRGARIYVVENLLDGATEWIQSGITTKVSFNASGLQSGKKYRVRVRAVGAAGLGPWSDEAVRMAA